MAKDPYRYFRIEARELLDGLTRGTMELEKGSGGKELVASLLRFAHTLKGASRVVKLPDVAELAHKIEGALTPFRDDDSPLPAVELRRMMDVLDAIGAKITAIERPAGGAAMSAAKPEQPVPIGALAVPQQAGEAFDSVRVDIEELDRLLEGISRIATELSSVRRIAGDIARHSAALDSASSKLNPAVLRKLLADSEQAEAELSQVRELSNEMRLLPVAAIFSTLERAVRDAAQSVQKKVDFNATGGDVRMDAQVLAALRNALIHVVRNSVAHGIETERERSAAGKAVSGRVSVQVERRGDRIALACSDDGRGIDIEAIRRAATQRGLLSPEQATDMNLAQIVQIIVKGGVTTTSSVTELSGRGIGLDIVRDTVARLKGELSVDSQPGQGTRVEICVPVSLSSLSALIVESAGIAIAIPLDSVRRTLRLTEAEIARSHEGCSVHFEGAPIPFLPLAKVLHRSVLSARRRHWTAVIVQYGSRLAALSVDHLMGASRVFVRPVPAPAIADPIVAGVSLTADGGVQLLLDPAAIMDAALTAGAPEDQRPADPQPPVLIVDDSLTTRMLEQSILTSAGYNVEVASSAEEALEKTRGNTYSLFVVDVEMPGMDGFEFVARTRADPILCKIPSVLVTSRNSPQDRLRGKQVGAGAYIVKSEFDQGFLLQTIRSLIG